MEERAAEHNEDTDLALLPIDPGHSQTSSSHWHAMLKQLFGGLLKSKCSIALITSLSLWKMCQTYKDTGQSVAIFDWVGRSHLQAKAQF